MKVVVACPAKVNLFLAVGPLDERGYHPLRTTFQAISMYDEIVLGSGGQGPGSGVSDAGSGGQGLGLRVSEESGFGKSSQSSPLPGERGQGGEGTPRPQQAEESDQPLRSASETPNPGPRPPAPPSETRNPQPSTPNPNSDTPDPKPRTLDPHPQYILPPDIPTTNTLTKTLDLIAEIAPLPELTIELRKGIPSQSGLGGGSSDAAGILRAIDAFLPEPLSMDAKLEIAAKVGKDVPFFLIGGYAKATGYGDILEPLPDLPTRWLVVVRPDVGVSTPEAYKALDHQPYEWRDFPTDPWALYNDFERVAPCVCGEIAERLQVLGATGAVLSGSGSAVFGIFESESEAQKVSAHFPGSWVCRTLTREESLAFSPQ